MYWLTSKLTVWALSALCIASVVAYASFVSYRTGYSHAENKVTAAWSAEREKLAKTYAEEALHALEVQTQMQSEVDQLKEQHALALDDIGRRYSAALAELRNRPARPSAPGVPAAPGAAVGCTGAQLAGPDAGFLAGYAADAARVAEALHACMAAYEVVRGEAKER